MKLLPIPLSPLGAPPSLNMWSSDLLWRYPPAPPSPLAELKTQLPGQLSSDPRLWSRDDVAIFLRWSEREFDLPKFDLDHFQMNGKAICLLSKTDFGERCPGAGDLVHNVLHMLTRDAQMLTRHLPSSPVTPTSRFPLSPHGHAPTSNWPSLPPPDSPFYSNHYQHFMVPNSVTLSPAPSNDSQAGSPPQHQEQVQNGFLQTNMAGAISNSSDSDEEVQLVEAAKSNAPSVATSSNSSSRTNNPPAKHLPPPLILEPKILNAWSLSDSQNRTPTPSPSTPSNNSNSVKREFFPNPPTPSTPSNFYQLKREFFPESPEPNTNGRLLWDFLQQLLNDPQQRYSSYIAWKCRDTGVFKIVDPPGLAKLWGIQKNHLSMNYDKMSRALRYYYRVNILRKVQGERHCYQFLRNPSELKSIKNISLLRQTMVNQAAASRDNTQTQSQYRNYVKQEQSVSNVLPPSPSYNGSMASMIANVNHQHLNAIPLSVSTSSKQSSPIPPTSAINCATQSSIQSIAPVKMESNEPETDDKPTDLSTNADRKYTDPSDCFKLIQSSNGLTTIQILRNENCGNYTTQENTERLRQPSSPQSQLQFQQTDSTDEMPTDLSKSEVISTPYYK